MNYTDLEEATLVEEVGKNWNYHLTWVEVLWKLPESQNENDNVVEVLQCLLKRSVNVKLRWKFTELLFGLILSGLISYHVIDKVSLFSSSSTVLWLLFCQKIKPQLL